MSTTLLTRIGAGALAAGLALGALSGGPVAAKGSDARVERRGACTAGATWKLKGKKDSGALEVEWEVDSNRVGQTWSVALSDNGVRVFTGTRRTVAPSGSFSVERRIPDRTGTDVIRATSVHAATGQRCTATISV